MGWDGVGRCRLGWCRMIWGGMRCPPAPWLRAGAVSPCVLLALFPLFPSTSAAGTVLESCHCSHALHQLWHLPLPVVAPELLSCSWMPLVRRHPGASGFPQLPRGAGEGGGGGGGGCDAATAAGTHSFVLLCGESWAGSLGGSHGFVPSVIVTICLGGTEHLEELSRKPWQ